MPDEPKGFAGPFKNQIGNVGQRTEPMLEAYTLLGAIAARTTRASLGTMVTGVTYRNPALLAKIVTTLDVVSRGRAILGLGAAWNDDEHAGYGFEFPAVGERMGRLEEALQICRAMFTSEAPTFSGRYYQVSQALNNPGQFPRNSGARQVDLGRSRDRCQGNGMTGGNAPRGPGRC